MSETQVPSSLAELARWNATPYPKAKATPEPVSRKRGPTALSSLGQLTLIPALAEKGSVPSGSRKKRDRKYGSERDELVGSRAPGDKCFHLRYGSVSACPEHPIAEYTELADRPRNFSLGGGRTSLSRAKNTVRGRVYHCKSLSCSSCLKSTITRSIERIMRPIRAADEKFGLGLSGKRSRLRHATISVPPSEYERPVSWLRNKVNNVVRQYSHGAIIVFHPRRFLPTTKAKYRAYLKSAGDDKKLKAWEWLRSQGLPALYQGTFYSPHFHLLYIGFLPKPNSHEWNVSRRMVGWTYKNLAKRTLSTAEGTLSYMLNHAGFLGRSKSYWALGVFNGREYDVVEQEPIKEVRTCPQCGGACLHAQGYTVEENDGKNGKKTIVFYEPNSMMDNGHRTEGGTIFNPADPNYLVIHSWKYRWRDPKRIPGPIYIEKRLTKVGPRGGKKIVRSFTQVCKGLSIVKAVVEVCGGSEDSELPFKWRSACTFNDYETEWAEGEEQFERLMTRAKCDQALAQVVHASLIDSGGNNE